MTEEPGEEDRLIHRLIDEAVKTVFDQSLTPKQFRETVEFFEGGGRLELTGEETTTELLAKLDSVRGLRRAGRSVGDRVGARPGERPHD